MNFTLPPQYDLKYTLDYLIKKMSADTGKPIMEIVDDLAGVMQYTTRMVMYYRKEKIESQRTVLNDNKLKEIGTYFGVQPTQLITEQVIRMTDEQVHVSGALTTDSFQTW